ncbi:MAG TPA: ABC transporter ATP-binding protein [Gemmatimonadaceae bacterium]|jgi:ABC-type multidrug transport system fused ATPase/permease subunit|nr:ABC transporter ATP-binding protein [Gemmatimonadaceae bacterium]
MAFTRATHTTRSGAWTEARALLWQNRLTVCGSLLLVALNRMAALGLPIGSKYLVDDVIGHGHVQIVPLIAGVAAIAVTVEVATGFGLSELAGRGAQRAITELRTQIQAHVMHLPIGFFDREPVGAIISRILSDTEHVQQLLGAGVVQLLSGLLTAAIACALMITLNWPLTVLILLILVAMLVVLTTRMGRVYANYRGVGRQTAALTARLAEVLAGIRDVKGNAAELCEARTFERLATDVRTAVVRTIRGISVMTAVSSLASGAIGFLVLVIGGRAVLAHTMTLGELTMYSFLVALLTSPLVQIAAAGNDIGHAAAGLARIHELRLVATEDQEDHARGARAVPRLTGAIRFDDVSYGYGAGPLAIQNVSFSVPAGSMTALVGRTGSGKSTICRLLLAFDRPASGHVLVDERDLVTLRRRDYRGQVGVVLQDTVVFDGTVRENIRYARPEASQDAVEWASRMAHCEEFVLDLPRGYDTPVGERGIRLSGGQRQRIAIARALLADPRILILDEATSHLDSQTEALVQDALRTLAHGRTTLVIAHRLSTVLGAHQIIVLSTGKIVERGTHRELLAGGGLYRQLHDIQHRGPSDLVEVSRRACC